MRRQGSHLTREQRHSGAFSDDHDFLVEIDSPFCCLSSLEDTAYSFQSSDVTVIEELELPIHVPVAGGRYLFTLS